MRTSLFAVLLVAGCSRTDEACAERYADHPYDADLEPPDVPSTDVTASDGVRSDGYLEVSKGQRCPHASDVDELQHASPRAITVDVCTFLHRERVDGHTYDQCWYEGVFWP